MLWTPKTQYFPWPFEKEADLEKALAEVKGELFGQNRVYLDVKKLIGTRGKTQNIPDGYFATYQVAPISAITHVAEVASIEPWKDSGKYLLNFKAPPREIGPHKLVPGGKITAPQAPRYTSFARLGKAKSLDEVFG